MSTKSGKGQFSTSCNQNSQSKILVTDLAEMDKSWLSGQPCKAPCWYGLLPGSSSRKDALENTKVLPFIYSHGIKEGQYNRWNGKIDELIKTIDLPCINPQNQSCAYIESRGDIISTIMLYPNFNITFMEAVNKIGLPDLVYSSRENPEKKDCRMGLIWIKQKMEIINYQSDTGFFFSDDICDLIFKNGGKIPKNLIVEEVLYLDDKGFS